MTDDLGDQFERFAVLVPSRVGLDENSQEWIDFSHNYEAMYEGTPVRSIPNYAAAGYDVAGYFLPVIARNGGDFNNTVKLADQQLLQFDMDLQRMNAWGGLLNMTGYLLKFPSSGVVEKVLIQ